MGGIAVADFHNLVTRSQPILDRNRTQDIASAYQNVICGWIYDNFCQEEPDGTSVRRNVTTELGNNFKRTQLFDSEAINVNQGAAFAEEKWAYTFNGYAYDLRAVDQNAGKSRIVNYLIEERAKCFGNQAESMETEWWSGPSNDTDATEKLKARGVAHIIITSATKGFNGTTPTNFTTVHGLSPTTYSQWKNYTDTFAAVSEDDFFDACREMLLKIKWKAYASFPGHQDNSHKQFMFCGTDLMVLLQKQAKLQNENLRNELIMFGGNDPAFPDRMKMGSQLTVHGIPLIHVPWLDDNEPQTKTLYCIDFDTFYPVKHSGWWMREEGPDKSATSGVVIEKKLYCTHAPICENRRRQGVMYSTV